MIPMDALEVGRVYKIRSRNFEIAVYAGHGRFIGIRTKFGSRYLFTEYHWETGPPYGTVRPQEALDVELGELLGTIKLTESLGSIDQRNGRPVSFDRPVVDGGRGWYYLDTGESDQAIRPRVVSNQALFAFLDRLERA